MTVKDAARTRSRHALAVGLTVAVALWSTAASALEGKVLLIPEGRYRTGDLVLMDLASGARTTLVSGGVFGPCFSPDGAQAAFWKAGKLHTIDLDGQNLTEVCDGYSTDFHRQTVSWALDDHLYWSEAGPYIYRVNLSTRQRGIAFATADRWYGMAKVSLDGTRAAASKPMWEVWTMDLVTQQERFVDYGCQGTVSPNGQLVTRNLAGHISAAIHRYDDGSVYTIITVPPGVSDATSHRFSTLSNDHVLFTSESHEGFVCDIHTDTSTSIGAGAAWDYMPPGQPAPVMLVHPPQLDFVALRGALPPPAERAALYLGGEDVACALAPAAGGDASWLDAALEGEGDYRNVRVEVSLDTLAPGLHTAELEVSCPGVSNSPQRLLVSLRLDPVSFPLRVNSGRNDFDVEGWYRDDLFVSGGIDWTNTGDVFNDGVDHAAPLWVYFSGRRENPHTYNLPVPDGAYLLRLHFADEYGDRSMNYTAEGTTLLQSFDVSSLAGGSSRALVREFEIEVADGDGLQLLATSNFGDVLECGLELYFLGADNAAPLVDAGLDREAAVGAPLLLDATVSDDGLPAGQLSLSWSALAGPAEVGFDDPTAADTLVTFSRAGDYLLELAADDGELAARDQVAVVVHELLHPEITLLQPNGGERWQVGSTQRIRWSAIDLDDVAIHYSTDDGATWAPITPSVDRDAPGWESFPWLIPNHPSSACRVQISGYFGEVPTRSAAPFAIVRPDAGDAQDAGSSPDRADSAPSPGVSETAAGGCGCGAAPAAPAPTLAALLLIAITGRRRARAR